MNFQPQIERDLDERQQEENDEHRLARPSIGCPSSQHVAQGQDYFGGRNIGAIIGVLYTSVAIGTLVGPSAAGFAFDLTHSYGLVTVASVLGNLIAVGIRPQIR